MSPDRLASLVVELWRAKPSSERTEASLRTLVRAYATTYALTDPATLADLYRRAVGTLGAWERPS